MKGELLLIEDSQNTQMIVRRILERQGYALQTANDGVSGLEKLEEMQPKVVLLDISLPEMDGMEIARRVRDHENEAVKASVLIALTAMGTTGDRDRFFDAGCDDHLAKPFRATQLVEIVDAYMSDDYVPSEMVSPGARRREKLREIAAMKAAAAEVEEIARGEQSAEAEKPPEPPPVELKKMPAPKEQAEKKKSEKKKSSRTNFKVGDDFLSDLLEPNNFEPTDPEEGNS
jgi:CheY-like chemotaxis protein